MNQRDMTAALVFFGLAVATVAFGSKLPFGKLSSPQAGFFPLLIGVLLAVLSLILFGQAFKGRHERRTPVPTKPAPGGKPLFLTIGGLFAFTFCFEYLGYLISTFLFMAFLLEAIGSKKWWIMLLVAFFTTLISYLLFGVFLNTPLPSGLL
jgi:putative tricarboxylic transport membrane protein